MRLQLIWICLALSFHATFAQDPWINSLPMYYNPSFAGSASGARIATSNIFSYYSYNSYYLPPSNGSNFINQNDISVDHFFPKISCGVGLTLGNHNFDSKSSTTDIRNYKFHFKGHTNNGSFALSPKISFKGKYTLAPSIQFEYNILTGEYDRTFEKITLGDTTIFDSINTIKGDNAILKTGLLFNSDKFFIGTSWMLFDKNIIQSTYNSHLKVEASLISGYTISGKKFFAFTPIVYIVFRKPYNIYGNSSFFNYITGNFWLNFKYKKVIAGLTPGDGYVPKVMIGYQSEHFKIMLANIKFWPGATSQTYGGQLSLRYQF